MNSTTRTYMGLSSTTCTAHMCDVHTMTCTLLHIRYSTPCTCSKAWLGRSHGKCLSESRLVFCTWNHPEFWFFKVKGGYNELEDFDYLKPRVVVPGKSNVRRIIELPVGQNFEWSDCTMTVNKRYKEPNPEINIVLLKNVKTIKNYFLISQRSYNRKH